MNFPGMRKLKPESNRCYNIITANFDSKSSFVFLQRLPTAATATLRRSKLLKSRRHTKDLSSAAVAAANAVSRNASSIRIILMLYERAYVLGPVQSSVSNDMRRLAGHHHPHRRDLVQDSVLKFITYLNYDA